jgi:hypothetical protein
MSDLLSDAMRIAQGGPLVADVFLTFFNLGDSWM